MNAGFFMNWGTFYTHGSIRPLEKRQVSIKTIARKIKSIQVITSAKTLSSRLDMNTAR